jgi:hypothetical protein
MICKKHAKFDNNEILISYCPSITDDFCSRSRHAKKITAPVRSAGPTPVPSPGATGQAGQAGIYLIFRGLFFEHHPREIGSAFHRSGAEIGARLNIKDGFNRASKKTIYGWTIVSLNAGITGHWNLTFSVKKSAVI